MAHRPVVIDARAAVRAQIGGVERLAREMANRLPQLNPERYQVIRPSVALAHRAGHVWEQAVLPLQATGAALIYCPANLAPLASRHNVVVVHDAAALRHPDAYSRQYVLYQRVVLPGIVRRARLLITVSEFSRSELAAVLSAPPERVEVIPPGVDERFSPRAEGPLPEAYGLSKPYVLVVATSSERKNLGALAEASQALAQRGVEIVLAGSGRHYLRTGEVPIRQLGYVAEEHLPALYARALALALPSRYEGFGLPCLEAMACGTPVVAAASAALPETVGMAGLLVGADDRRGFAEALMAAAFDEEVRSRLITEGRARAAQFTWDATTQRTDRAIGELLSGVR